MILKSFCVKILLIFPFLFSTTDKILYFCCNFLGNTFVLMKTGLVLEGGGMRGLFSAGVMDVMMEQGIRFDGMIGVSAGAAFGCNYKSHQLGRALRYNIRFSNDPKYMGLRTLWHTGELVNGEYAYHTIPTQLDIFDTEAFAANPMEFQLVCTDANTGKPVYKRLDTVDYEALEWVRASASMPLVSHPVKLEGRELLDGGITDSIPLRHFQEEGYTRNIVILTQPKGFTKKRTKLMPLFHLFMRKYPKIIEAMSKRHLMYNEQLAYLRQQELLGNTIVIYPQDTLPIGRTEQTPGKLRHVYELGRQTALEHLQQITVFINQDSSPITLATCCPTSCSAQVP